jgi:repressor LexA
MSTAEAGSADEGKPGGSAALSLRQGQIVRAIRDSIVHHGYPPTEEEIGIAVGLKSRATVGRQLRILEGKGVLHRGPGRRAIELLPPWGPTFSAPEDTVPVPLLGRIAAGPLNLAVEDVEDVIPLPRWLVPRSGEVFLLRVFGDSMIGAAIAGGDLVLVRVQPVAENGDIVAARIDGEATVKTLRRATGHVWLMPHNAAYTPIPGDNVDIMGKVVSVLRKVE